MEPWWVPYNIYNEARQLIAQYEKVGTGALTWKRDIVYVGTKEIAEVDATGTEITFVDHLGSPRYAWRGGTTPVIKQKFLPFGEQLTDPTTAKSFAKGFTNHEQTDPSGLIYMQARFYAPWYGRFLSPDPARDQHFDETQSWNIYSYVQNNPTNKLDPTGMFEQSDRACLIQQMNQAGMSKADQAATLKQFDRVQAVGYGTAATLYAGAAAAPAVAGAVTESASTGMLARVGTSLTAVGNWLKDKAGQATDAARNLFSKGSEFQNVTVEEIKQLNSANGGSTELTGKVDTVLANMSYREGFADKASTLIRDIAGRHLFNDANKRTTQQAVELLAGKNKISLNPDQLRGVIQQVAEGKLRSVEDISRALSQTIKK